MTLKEWIDLNLGKGIDFDNHFSFQCMDVYRDYVQKVLQYPQSRGLTPPIEGAADVWTTYLTEYFTATPNSATNFPEAGDIIIYKKLKSNGFFGHIAIVEKADINRVTIIEQDGITNSLLKRRETSYVSVIGWLHPKAQSAPIGRTYSEEEYTVVRLERDTNWNLYQKALEDHKTFVEKVAVSVGCANSEEAIFARIKTLNTLEDQLSDARSEAKKQQELFDQEKAELNRKIDSLTEVVNKQQKENENILIQLQNLKESAQTIQEKEEIVEAISPEVEKEAFTLFRRILKLFRL